MRPPGAVLSPGESIIATGTMIHFFFLFLAFCLFSHVITSFEVFKFVEHPENDEKQDQKSKVKFKIVSLKVNEPMEYVPELVGLFRPPTYL